MQADRFVYRFIIRYVIVHYFFLERHLYSIEKVVTGYG